MRLARGVTRTVLLVGSYAVKVPRLAAGGPGRGLAAYAWALAHGLLANLSEREWSNHPGVCPVVWSAGGLVNVYRRAHPAPDGPIDYRAIAPGLLVDPRPGNVGILDGRLVWVDYDQHAGECVACARYLAGRPG